MALPVSYRVAMPKPHSHLFEVQAHFPPAGDEVRVCFPVWTPGSYLVREYARHLQDLRVTDLAGGPLPFERVDKCTLRVQAGNTPVRLNYRVYCNELTVRTSHLDGSHGYFNGATLFGYVEALRRREHRVAVHAPEGWRVTAALPHQGIDFIAGDYDELIDTPFEIGPHTPLAFTAAGVPHEVVLWGDLQCDERKLVADMARIVETEAALFGGLPMKRYVFHVYATDKGRGGLEHKASTALLFPRHGLSTPRGHEDFLGLVAHEYFHLWNIKRIKPRALVPYDYSRENYTQLLWFFEGGTSYYDSLLVRRANLLSPARYLLKLGECITAMLTTPGRRVLALSDASMLAWVKHYRPDENSPNSAISYYVKGELVCLLLDLHIRRSTQDGKSLDDVLRLLWQRHGDESGVPEDGVEHAAAEIAGRDLSAFFDRALRSTEELDFEVLSHVGLELRLRPKESTNDKGGTPPRNRADKSQGYLGIFGKGPSTISTVLDDSPAMQAGLSPDDELVALDGFKCDFSTLTSRCEEKRPGEVVKVTVFRREKLLTLTLTLGQKPSDHAYLTRVDKPTEQQKASYRAWLSSPWDELDKDRSESKTAT